MCSAESRDCWKRGRYDQTSRPCTRSRMRPRPGRTSPGTCQGFMGCRPVGRERQDAGHTARSCFVWPRHLSTSAVFGVLNTLIGIGMIVGTQLLTRFARHIPQQNLVVYGLGGMGIAVLTTAAFGTMGSTAAGRLRVGRDAAAAFSPPTALIHTESPL